MLWSWLLACSSTVQPLSLDRAPTEQWLALGVALRPLPGGQWEEGADRATLTYTDRRWGTDRLTLVADFDGSSAGRHQARLANGSRVRFDETKQVDHRVSTATLTGVWEVEQRRFSLTCVGHAEAELTGASARWCLPVLASGRLVEPKP